MFYSKINTYGSETSVGFANTWSVIAFETKKARDSFVQDNYLRMDIEAVKRSDVPKFHGCTVEPFSGQKIILRDVFPYTTNNVIVSELTEDSFAGVFEVE